MREGSPASCCQAYQTPPLHRPKYVFLPFYGFTFPSLIWNPILACSKAFSSSQISDNNILHAHIVDRHHNATLSDMWPLARPLPMLVPSMRPSWPERDRPVNRITPCAEVLLPRVRPAVRQSLPSGRQTPERTVQYDWLSPSPSQLSPTKPWTTQKIEVGRKLPPITKVQPNYPAPKRRMYDETSLHPGREHATIGFDRMEKPPLSDAMDEDNDDGSCG